MASPMKPVRVGLLLPQYDCEIAETMSTALAADAAGLDIWIAGQVFPISSEPQKAAFEPLTLMGALAAATTTARLGFMVLAAPYYPSVHLAKAMITLDHLSGGRIEVGLGAGWREEEFAALGVPFEDGARRRRQLEERIDAIEALGAGRAATAPDGTEVSSGPIAVQSPLPLWIAGRGPKILELVGRRASWANFARGISIEDFAEAAAAIRRSAAAAGREDGGPRLSLTGTFLGGADEDEVASRIAARAAERGREADVYRQQLLASNALVGTPGAIADQLRRYREAGCEAVILWPLDGNHAEAPQTLAALRGELEE
jgi:alkanesulfonate monooxygenase SsuD/methylene tetrahydromethanopterin reductase-like flavin-dependent oxidoreductase (luciferase family)